ncbi:MAG TPA: ABC transporter substrate-binding protein [Candidatus Pacearchaeota archaeon]|nr:ABC transporter substrate-binding protein [Candidatus Pacearchaeota archaeon]
MSKILSFLKIEKFPSKKQWKKFFKVLNKKEKIIFIGLIFLFIFSSVSLISLLYLKNTKEIPKKGGIYIEGVIGQPSFINPIYANSDVDRDLTELIFSSLMKYDKDTKIIPQMIEDYKIEEDGKVYKFKLKENLLWQDNTPITADDIIFTIKTIQNPESKSTLYGNWIGVETEKIDDFTVKFSIKQPYSSFLENFTLKILPKHLLENVDPKNLSLELYNLKPTGSGPYKINEIKQGKNGKIESITLTPNSYYFEKEPYISQIKFLFFDNEEDLIKAAKKGEIKSFTLNYYNKFDKNFNIYKLSFPRYFALFLNPQKAKPLSETNIRIALNHATNKKEIVEKALQISQNDKDIEEIIVDSPILPQFYGYKKPEISYEFNPEKAIEILEKNGYKNNESGIREKIITKEASFKLKSDLKFGSKGTEVEQLQKCLSKLEDIYPNGEISGYFGENTKQAVIKFQEKYADEILKPNNLTKGTGIVSKGTRNKLNELCFKESVENIPLKFSLLTVNQPQLIETAEILKEQWKKIGVDIEIESLPPADVKEKIRERDYQILLYGEVLGMIPDLFPYWYSTQKKDPGSNLSLYENKEVDKLLEEIRKTQDLNIFAEKLNEFQNILLKDAPAIFLYNSYIYYYISNEIKGIDNKKIALPSHRFSGIEDFYIKTKRIFK